MWSQYAPTSPLGFAVALTALYHGASLYFGKADSDETIMDDIVKSKATVLLLLPKSAKAFHQQVNDKFTNVTPFPNQVYAAKLWALRQGALDRDHPIWDRISLNKFRRVYGLDRVRTVVVFGQSAEDLLSQSHVDGLRIMLGACVAHGLCHPMHPVPLAVSNMRDFQFMPSQRTAYLLSTDEKHHVGPPSANIQLKVKLDDAEDDTKIQGQLLATGPALAKYTPETGTFTAQQERFTTQPDGTIWFKTGLQASIAPNGTVRRIEA